MHQLKTRKIKLILPEKHLPKKRLRRLQRQMNLKQNLVPNLLQTLRHQLKNRPKFYLVLFKVENILKGSLDLIPSPSPSVEIQIIGVKIYLRQKVC